MKGAGKERTFPNLSKKIYLNRYDLQICLHENLYTQLYEISHGSMAQF